MAKNTNLSLRGQLLYCVYVRNHGPNGTFGDVMVDLDRIKALGTDIVWFLPIHPIGEKNKKGSLGCPYSVRDYRAVNPEYGTLEDFRALLGEIHARGMKCMIDVVYNHTAWDSVLMQEHPEWFYRLPGGSYGNRAGEWSDVVDLDFGNHGLWEYLIQSLEYWAKLGVDGFRCDVASLVPLDFWLTARRRVEALKPGVVWLAESVHCAFLETQRQNGHECHSDGELYGAFDITYDYDIHALFEGYFAGRNTLPEYLAAMARQQSAYPGNFVKLRFLENHDQPRFASLVHDRETKRLWEAFCLFVRGTALLYAGQEAGEDRAPSLFDRDPVDWHGLDEAHAAWLRRLADLRHSPVVQNGVYSIAPAGEQPTAALVHYRGKDGGLYGVFNLEKATGEVGVPLPDGTYKNLADDGMIEVRDGKMDLSPVPVIVEYRL